MIGIGTLWGQNGLYSNANNNEWYLSNTVAEQKWHEMGCSGRIPVEQDGGAGTAFGHWDETCMAKELM